MPGMVQGVVVQMTTDACWSACGLGFSGAREHHRELHVDRRALDLLVLDLGLGKRGALHHGPHHRLRAAIEQPIHGELRELAGDGRLSVVTHRGVGMIPITLDAEALELLALHVEPVLGVGPAFAAEADDRLRVREVRLGLALGAIVLLLDLPLDGEAMAVPARHVIGILAHHGVRAGDDVFEDLIQPSADMDVAVGVRRPVMQDELRPAHGLLAQAIVKAHFGPALEQLRLALRQAGLHGEVGLRQEQRLTPVALCLRLDRLRRHDRLRRSLRRFGHRLRGLSLHGLLWRGRLLRRRRP